MAEATAATEQWSRAFLESRLPVVASTDEQGRVHAGFKWSAECATHFFGRWAERQVDHGRSGSLARELRSLELELSEATGAPLQALARVTRWLLGAFPGASGAWPLRLANVPTAGRIASSPAFRLLARGMAFVPRMTLPPRPDIDPVLATLAGHTGEVWSVALSPDGKRLATGSRDKTARVWDAETGEVV